MADTNKKLVDLSLLTYYDGKVANREDTKDTTVLNTAKGYTDTKIGEVSLPEIKDDATSTTDTWSSYKINNAITDTVDGAMNEKVDTKIDEKLEQSIADVSDVDALFGEA